MFLKNDYEKNRLELIDPAFIRGVGEVLTFGASKYGTSNWKQAEPEDVERVKGALLRHFMAYMDGEIDDPETGLQHLYHVATNVMFLSYYERSKNDRVATDKESDNADTADETRL